MTGTGTSDNPFVPSNWDEFKTACEESLTDVYISFPLNGEWNMNEQYPLGVPAITASGTTTVHIEGNGFVIKNLYAEGITVFTGKFEINDLVIDSANIRNSILFSPSGSGSLFMKFSVRGELNNSTFVRETQNYTMNFYQSGLSFRFLGATRMENAGNYRPILNFYYSRIDIAGETSGGNPFEVRLLVGSKVTGNLESTIGDDFWLSAGSTDCVVDIGLTGFNKVRCRKESGANAALLNVSKIGTATTQTGDNFIEATTEQMRNAEWLTAHGFPCYVRGE